MTKQAVIYFKDGRKDWIDPIEDAEIDIFYKENGKIISINNGYNEYDYNYDNVNKIEIIEI